MTLFATEFPVSPALATPRFTAEIIAWLRGIRSSRILDSASDADLDADAPRLKAPNGETPAIQRVSGADGSWATGFRHEMPDHLGRIWRTEGVLRNGAGTNGSTLLRMRGQCVASVAVARLEVPKRPHLIRVLIEQLLGGQDGDLAVRDVVSLVPDTEDGQLLAGKIIEGSASRCLPVVYVSAKGAGQWAVPRDDLDRLALDLAGIAHVVLEPGRDMAWRLRDLTGGRNAYGGTIGIYVPRTGLTKRLSLGWAIADEAALLAEVKTTVTQMRTAMGQQASWDWIDLQEAAIREVRQRSRNKLSDEDNEKLWADEIAAKDDRIADLTAQLAATRPISSASSAGDNPLGTTMDGLGPELYDGEYLDRIRTAVQLALSQGADHQWDRRSLAAFKAYLAAIPASAQLDTFLDDLRRATSDTKKLAKAVPAFLEKVGYALKSDKKHIRMEQSAAHVGLEPVTVPKTPGDHRSGENLKGHIYDALGLKRLIRQERA